MISPQHALAVRADLYGCFAALFSEPLDRSMLRRCREQRSLLPLIALPDARWSRAPLHRALGIVLAAPDTETATIQLNRDFGRLFLGIDGPGHAVPACQSDYPDGGAPHFGMAVEVATLLRSHGLAIAERCVEPADHISVQLALMECLIERNEPVAHAEADSLLQSHLLGWVPEFTARCVACDATGFYAALATLLLGFLRHEHARLADIPRPVMPVMAV